MPEIHLKLPYDLSRIEPIKLRSMHLRRRYPEDCKEIARCMASNLDLEMLDPSDLRFGKEGIGEFYISRTSTRIELLNGGGIP